MNVTTHRDSSKGLHMANVAFLRLHSFLNVNKLACYFVVLVLLPSTQAFSHFLMCVIFLISTIQCTQTFDSARSVKAKSQQLAGMIRKAKGKIIVHTGAGISTSAGVSDFRGPDPYANHNPNLNPSFSVYTFSRPQRDLDQGTGAAQGSQKGLKKSKKYGIR